MSNLYDEDELENSGSASVSHPLSAAQLEEIPPDLMATTEDNSQLAIIGQTKLLVRKLGQLNQIVLNAYRVSDFVPNCDTKEQEETWKGKITPILLKTINEDVVARLVITDSFSAIRVLTITIKSAYEIIRMTKGSPEAIEIAKHRIPEALDRINDCIERANKLTDYGMKQFQDNTQVILNMAGPEVAKRVMELAGFEDNINKALEKEYNFFLNLYKAEGDATRYENLMKVVDNKRDSVKKEIADIDKQKKEMANLNKEIDNRKQNIPDKVTTVKREVTNTKRFFFGLITSTNTKLVNEVVNNPNKVSDQNYYESVINARADRISKADQTADAKKSVLEDLDQQYSQYEKQYHDAMAIVKQTKKSEEEMLREIRKTIEENRKRIRDTREEAKKLETKFGHNGQTLIDCLTYVKSFGQSLKDGTSAYSPIKGILEDIKGMVNPQVDLLISPSPQSVFVAGKSLMHQAHFLSEYNVLAIEAVKQSQEYNNVSNAIEPKIQLLSIKD